MESIQVRNPRNGEFDYEFEVPEHEVLVRRAAALRAAQSAWGASPVEQRVDAPGRVHQQHLARAADSIARRVVVDRYRSLSEDSATRPRIAETIQKRTTIFCSAHPSFSKW